MNLHEIAELVGGRLEGEARAQVVSGHTIERAGGEHLAFWERRAGSKRLPKTQAACVLVDEQTDAAGQSVIRVAQPRNAFAKALRALLPEPVAAAGVHRSALVDPEAKLGEGVSVGPHAVIERGASIGAGTRIGAGCFLGENAALGQDCRLAANVSVYPGARLGNRVILHAGASIGADGFGLVFEQDHYEKFPQIGSVEIGDDVEIGANSCVDRGALDATRVGDGTKLDNLVHIGHNCQIGRHVVMAAQVGLSGGVRVDDYAVLGGQAGIGDRAHIGARVQLGGQGGLLPDKSLPPDGVYWGTPARPLRDYLAGKARLNRLAKWIEQIKGLRARIEKLERR